MYFPLETVFGMPNDSLNNSHCWSWVVGGVGGGGGPKTFCDDSGDIFGGDGDSKTLGGDWDADFGWRSGNFDTSNSGWPEKPLLKQLDIRKHFFEHPLFSFTESVCIFFGSLILDCVCLPKQTLRTRETAS